nr:sporulation integral membrane protein YlbJ [Heyndrickxia coagulans]
MYQSKLKSAILAFSVSIMAISMIVLPDESFKASIQGLNMWWEVVFPSLFPFFVISELLIGFGVVRFLGVLLEPLMRPLFRVPGVGGFTWAMGLASGNPSGAKLTARLRQEKQIDRIEAERLVAFTSSSSPLFIFGAVAVGFFHNPSLGILFAAAHYAGNIIVGLVMRFYGTGEDTRRPKKKHTFLLKEALLVLHATRIKNSKPIGKLLGDAVMSAIQTLLMIGGFIILFSVFNKLLLYMHVTSVLGTLVSQLLHLAHFSEKLSIPLISGLFEVTLGIQMISEVQESPLLQQVIAASFILGFGGFSIQAQVASILAQTDIRFRPFVLARVLHGFLSAMIIRLVWNPVYLRFFAEKSAWQEAFSMPGGGRSLYARLTNWLEIYGPLFTLSCLVLYIFLYYRSCRADRA